MPVDLQSTPFGHSGTDPESITLVVRGGTAKTSTGRWSEHFLHRDDIEPRAELSADLAFGADLGKSEALVQAD